MLPLRTVGPGHHSRQLKLLGPAATGPGCVSQRNPGCKPTAKPAVRWRIGANRLCARQCGTRLCTTRAARREKAAPARCPVGRGICLAFLSAALGPLGSSAACAPAPGGGSAAVRRPAALPRASGGSLRVAPTSVVLAALAGPSALVGRRPRFKSRRACCASSGGGGPRAGAAGLRPLRRAACSPPAARFPSGCGGARCLAAAALACRVGASGPPGVWGSGARRWPPAPSLVLVVPGSPLVLVPPGPLRPLSSSSRARPYPGPMIEGFPLASNSVLVAAWAMDPAPPEAGQDRAEKCAATERPGSVRSQLRCPDLHN